MSIVASRLELARVLPSGMNVSHMTEPPWPLKMKLRGCVFKNSVTVCKSSAFGTGRVFRLSAPDEVAMPAKSIKADSVRTVLHSRVMNTPLELELPNQIFYQRLWLGTGYRGLELEQSWIRGKPIR